MHIPHAMESAMNGLRYLFSRYTYYSTMGGGLNINTDLSLFLNHPIIHNALIITGIVIYPTDDQFGGATFEGLGMDLLGDGRNLRYSLP